MKAIVTGCAGYIGSVLVGELLKEGFEVMGVDSFRYRNCPSLSHVLGHPKFTLADGEAYEPSDWYTRDADLIFPLAALVGAPICQKWPSEASNINVKAIRRLMNLVDNNQKVIFPNTNSGYGQTDGQSEVTESDLLTPVSHYGRTKCEAERIVLDHPGSHVVFRLATVFGTSPRMRFDLMVNDFCEQIYIRHLRLNHFDDVNTHNPSDPFPGPLAIYEPHFMRNFVHVRDVCRAFVYLAHQNPTTGVFNCGHPDANLSKQDLAERICGHLGRNPADVLTESDGEDPDKRNYKVSNRKLLNTGFRFEFDIDQGIREVLQFCRHTRISEREGMRNFRS